MKRGRGAWSGRGGSVIRLVVVIVAVAPILAGCAATPAMITIGMPIYAGFVTAAALVKAVSHLARRAYGMTWRDLGRMIASGFVASGNAVRRVPGGLRAAMSRVKIWSGRDWLAVGAKSVYVALVAVPGVIVLYVLLLAIALFIEIPIVWPAVIVFFAVQRAVQDRVVQRAFGAVVRFLGLTMPSRAETDLRASNDMDMSLADLERDLSQFLPILERANLVKGQR